MKNRFHIYRLLGSLLLLTALSSCVEDYHPANDYAIKGIDVSRYQSVVNWAEVAKGDIDFVFTKATEGGDYSDPAFSRNWQALRENRIRRGAYHFFRPASDPKTQAKHFIKQVGELLPGDLPPVLDIEHRGGLDHDSFINSITSWLSLVESRYGIKPIIYSGQVFYNRHLAGQFDDYPIWIARYNDELPALADGRSFEFWQYIDKGKIPGITGPVDLNIFSGSQLDLALLSLPSHAVVGSPERPLATTK